MPPHDPAPQRVRDRPLERTSIERGREVEQRTVRPGGRDPPHHAAVSRQDDRAVHRDAGPRRRSEGGTVTSTVSGGPNSSSSQSHAALRWLTTARGPHARTAAISGVYGSARGPIRYTPRATRTYRRMRTRCFRASAPNPSRSSWGRVTTPCWLAARRSIRSSMRYGMACRVDGVRGIRDVRVAGCRTDGRIAERDAAGRWGASALDVTWPGGRGGSMAERATGRPRIDRSMHARRPDGASGGAAHPHDSVRPPGVRRSDGWGRDQRGIR